VNWTTIKALAKTMRPMQWSKNGFLLAALIFDRQLFNLPALGRALAAVLLFSLLSSAIYIYNDIRDIDTDRNHPRKRNRPIAAGILPVKVAYAAVGILLVLVFPLAYRLSPYFFLVALIYMTMNLAYSVWLKHVPIVDILILTGFYIIRVAAGLTIIKVDLISPWLFVFTTFLALFLGTGKRRAELSLLTDQANSHRKVLEGYTLPLLDQWISISSTLTIMTYSLYTFFAPGMAQNHWLMMTIPFVIYGVFRYMYLVQVKQRGGSPEAVLFSDHPLQAAVVLWGIAILLVYYIFPNA
jgi:4-hydroxybenzoate polyprenyltransferase